MCRGSLARHYKRVLRGGAALGPAGGELEGFEGTTRPAPEADLSKSGIKDRLQSTRHELHRIVKDYLGNKAELYEIADKIAKDGQTALRAVSDEDDDKLADGRILASLEVIVRIDGSRPSFMVRNGEPDLKTSPVGEWQMTLDDRNESLRKAMACVGRIDDPSGAQGFQGTGILIGEGIVMTNRHVLQAIATETRPGKWRLKPDIAIDFGHEYAARRSVGRRRVKSVVFAASEKISDSIDHSKLDLALLEVEPDPASSEPLALDIATDWGAPAKGVFICGYPGDPGWQVPDSLSLLEQLFQSTYGYKRLAPGLVTTVPQALEDSPRGWSLGHDATTLRGNSGSAVFVLGRESLLAGLHFGGRPSDPRENWCHVIGRTLDEPDTASKHSLRDILKERGVTMRGRVVTEVPNASLG